MGYEDIVASISVSPVVDAIIAFGASMAAVYFGVWAVRDIASFFGGGAEADRDRAWSSYNDAVERGDMEAAAQHRRDAKDADYRMGNGG
ncbi:hypothetical protein [Xanthomonas sp. NCPPB 2632]|uniref:hypothetical protein n=1 Tax=Xanthomonas sp. NCPPB 2632 TaxID=3240912 RepID=UPI003513413D